MKNRFFCTYFDKNYLYRGLALYFSMVKFIDRFTLYILCMDEKTYEILIRMRLKSVELIKIDDFVDSKLKGAKEGRSLVEFYWTCTPSLPLHIFNLHKNVDLITYLDSDLMFFSSPEAIFDELGEKSILAIEHRFGEQVKEDTTLNGKYCVQYLTFRRDDEGLSCLKRWRKQCIDWCYYRQEDGLMGDQAYLTEWDSRYKNLHSVKNLGAGLAPWNISNYNIKKRNKKIYVNKCELIFFHYHAMRMYSITAIDPAEGYVFSKNDINLIYRPYFEEIDNARERVKEIDPSFHHGYSRGILNLTKFRLRYLLKPRLPFLFKSNLK